MKIKKRRVILLVMLLSIAFGTLTAAAVIAGGDSGMRFDGLAEYKTAAVDMPLPTTYEATVRLSDEQVGRGGVILGSYKDDGTACFNFEITSGGSPRLYIIDSASVKYDVTFSSINVYTGAKTHIAIVLDRTAGSWICYVNGAAAETVTAAIPTQFDLNTTLALGGDNLPGNYEYFKGELFGAALYSDVRSAAEIASDAEATEVDSAELITAYAPLSDKSEGASVAAIGDEKYNIVYKCEWIKELSAPENFAYSFAVIGDIQSMTYYYPDHLIDQFEWIADNAAERKIAFSVGLGDITEKNTAAEYLKAVEAYDKIDGTVPFSIIRGNHERTSTNDTTMFDTYITKAKYGDEITGSYDDTMQNTYRIIQIGKVKYMFMNLDLTLTDGAIAWANEIIAAHPECHVVLSTHVYKNMSGSYLVLDGKFGAENNPEDLWNELISQHENIVMVLYGHSPKDTIYKKQRAGVNGNIVTEMLINPSETDKRFGGGGFVAMFYFSDDGEQLDVQYYSTAKGAYFKEQNQFHLELDTPGIVEFSDVIMNVGRDQTERNMTWYSPSSAAGEIRYGKSDNGQLPESYSTVKATAVKSEKVGYYSYKASMVGLEENSTYVYQLVLGGSTSECYSFNTYGMGDDFSFAFITDPQVKKELDATRWDDTLYKIKNSFNGVSLIVSGGDQTSEPSREDNFDWFISDHLTSIPIATTVGPPHDNSKLYTDHYNLPNLSTTWGISTPSSDYFYTYNNVLFMHLNVENKDYDGHVEFVENAIADNPDCLWRVVLLHYSFFSGGNHSTDASVVAFREAIAGKLNSLGVDVVLSGHDHVYARSNMMTDGYTLSGDTVTNGSVTNPSGTLYVCGTSSTGSGWYNVEHEDDNAYIAKSVDTNRKSVVIFKVSEGSLTLTSYFVDGSMPEEFDRFTIYKTKKTVRLNESTDMLEILDGEERIPLVNAYAYASATVKVVGGYWSLSTDGGASFASLGIASSDTQHVLRINESTGCWELSGDGGASFETLGIKTNTYTVRYVALAGAAFGDSTDLGVYSPRRFTAATPDAPMLYMPKGSISVGGLYDWSWEYYLEGGDGTPVTSFSYGERYVAYPVHTTSPVASTIYVSTVSSPEEYTYTWAEAWDIVMRCSGEKVTLALKSDVTLTAEDVISIVIPVDVTLDLAGKRLDTSALEVALKFGIGSNGSVFRLVTSVSGGTLNAGTSSFIEMGSNQGSTLNIQYGSPETKPLTVESIGYLVDANGNFKYGSTLNLSVYAGSYTISKCAVYVTNIKVDQTPNVYKVELKDAEFNFPTKQSGLVYAKSTAGFYAAAASYINATNCSFIDTYNANHTSQRPLIRYDCWYGSASFTGCEFLGMTLGLDYNDASLANCGAITVGAGCSFISSDKSFTDSNPRAFLSDKIVLADGCVLARTDATGSMAVLDLSDAVEIDWSNPVGYKEYWKRGTTPAYLGADSFTVGEKTYSLVLSETPSVANANKTYNFVSVEGYLYRYNSETDTWQISTDGGNTYTNITGSETDPTPEPEPEPEPEPGCTVTLDGVVTSYPASTNFSEVIETLNVSANAGKEILVTLTADMTASSTFFLNKSVIIRIDLAGHKLTLAGGAAFKFSSNYTLQFYSSVAGAELVFNSTSDDIQPGKGTLIIGSDVYKNTLTVTSPRAVVSTGQTADGSLLRFKFLYCTINTGAYGILRLNVKGAGKATVEAEITGCTVNGSTAVVLYNASSNLAATTNGGVLTADSFINVSYSTFNCTAASPLGFFGSGNFTDRYFGKVSFSGCTFRNYILNGDLIRSDEALSYNSYYDTLAGTGYDPTKAITVGKDCVFYTYGDSFTDDLGSFTASNISLSEGCAIVYTAGSVMTLDTAEHPISEWRSEGEQHWKVCTVCDDGVKFNLSECNMVDGVCTVCGAGAEPPVIPDPEHTYEAVVTPPTCTERGYTTYTCSQCGDSYVDNYVTANGHVYGEWAVVTPPSCTEDGEKAKICTECGETKSEAVGATGHTLISHEAKAPGCTEVGWAAYEACASCNYTTYSEIPATGHDYADATCEAAKTCKVCGATDGEALGHDYSDATCETAKTCKVCGATDGEALGHDWADATCEVAKTCKVCGATDGEALGHDWTDATCEAAKTCKVCGTTDGEALGHDWADATCEAAKTCKVCGATDGEALGHDWADATTEAPKTCERCGATDGEKLPDDTDGGKDDTDGGSTGDENTPDDTPEQPSENHDSCTAGWFSRFWNAIVNFFRSMFGMPKLCVCGKEI